MSGSARSERLLDALSRLSPQQAALRLLVLLGAGGFLLAERAAGSSFSGWWLGAVAVAAVAAAVLPDSFAPLALVLLLGGHWAFELRDELGGGLLVATGCLLVVHVAAALASYGPTSVVLDAGLLRLWAVRATVAVAAAVPVWALGRVGAAFDLPAGGPVLAVALLVLLGWAVVLGRHAVTRS